MNYKLIEYAQLSHDLMDCLRKAFYNFVASTFPNYVQQIGQLCGKVLLIQVKNLTLCRSHPFAPPQ